MLILPVDAQEGVFGTFTNALMKQTSDNIVIGICSPSGGRKTALVSTLSQRIKDSVTMSFDDYGVPSGIFPFSSNGYSKEQI